MAQQPIGQRIKFIVDSQQLSVRRFAQLLDIGETNIRNYLDKGTKPSSDVLEKMALAFPRLNMDWLVTGKGEAFLSDEATNNTGQAITKNNYGNNVGQNVGTNTQYAGTGSPDCERQLAACQAQLLAAQGEVTSLKQQLERADALVAAKDETISLLRATYNRPN